MTTAVIQILEQIMDSQFKQPNTPEKATEQALVSPALVYSFWKAHHSKTSLCTMQGSKH